MKPIPVDYFGRDVYCIGGLPFDATDLPGAVRQIRTAVDSRRSYFVSTPNLNFLVAARTDADFRASVLASDLSLADGMPLVWLARLLGVPIRHRVAGASVFDALRGKSDKPLSVYFFGGPEGAAGAALEALAREGGGLSGAGFQTPGFGDVVSMSGADRIAAINSSGADLLVVSLGARKGQAWIMRNRARLSVPVVSHLGAVVNFAAGTLRRAPAWMQNVGLEWLWRIKEEPTLWRRYWHDGIGFAGLVLGCVIPYGIWLWWNWPKSPISCDVRFSAEDDVFRLAIHGDLPDPAPEALREAFRAAASQARPVLLDLTAARFLGPGFFGLLLLLVWRLGASGSEFRILVAGRRLRRLFSWNAAGFLLTPETINRADYDGERRSAND